EFRRVLFRSRAVICNLLQAPCLPPPTGGQRPAGSQEGTAVGGTRTTAGGPVAGAAGCAVAFGGRAGRRRHSASGETKRSRTPTARMALASRRSGRRS